MLQNSKHVADAVIISWGVHKAKSYNYQALRLQMHGQGSSLSGDLKTF